MKEYSNGNQHCWAFLRALEAIDQKKIKDSNIITSDLFRKTKQLQNDLEPLMTARENSYSISYDSYLSFVQSSVHGREQPTEIEGEDVLDKYSRTKYLEKDSYRSIGAYWDVVGNETNMHDQYYIDSILDNYGFLLENLFMTASCIASIDLNLRLLRVAKYLERISKAYLIIEKNAIKKVQIEAIKTISGELNILRKKNSYDVDQLNKKLIALYQKLDANDTKSISIWPKIKTIFSGSPITQEASWVNLINTIFIYPVLKMCEWPSQQSAGASIYILKRKRKIVNNKYVLYKGELITLRKARQLENQKKY